MNNAKTCTFRRAHLKSVLPYVTLLFFPAFLESVAQPDWVATYGRSDRFGEGIYLTGFGIAQARDSSERIGCCDRAQATARRNLAEKVRISLQNSVVSRQQEINQTISQYFSATTQAVSALEIEGLENESYDVPGKQTCFALAYVRRENLVTTYSRKIEALRAKMNELVESARRYEKKGDRERALKALTSCYPLIRELEQSKGIVFAVASESPAALAGMRVGAERDRITVRSIEDAVADLLKRPVRSVEDAAYLIALLLKEQVGQDVSMVTVEPFTYQETEAASSFSRYFRKVLSGELVNVSGWRVVEELPQESVAGAIIIGGTYWEQDGGLKVLVSASRVGRSQILAGVNTFIPRVVARKVDLRTKPENLQVALADQKQFMKQDITPVGLNLEVWTNRGSRNPLFSKGERMSVYVRLNVPAYVRFVYHLADGRRALLLDNYHLGETDLNKPFLIPQQFECLSPYGVEVLQVSARTEPFDNVPTTKIDGYDILTSDLGEFLAVTRGMKAVKQPVMQAERRVVLTTVDK